MNTRKAYTNVIKFALGFIMFLSAMGMACDGGPACSDPIQCAVNVAVPTQQNILSGGNPTPQP